ncbi:hypothetical protein OS493_031859 [Desmophyllum pertusum]|uniref:Uncharacterized protein n=1 Tax=Desmophyllum pertusum TaxID=174260 RepID=A0A9W9Y8N1_9CNID|nr:hypothetical protein OS493_031859 [Desmophyllum pertusum]
MAVFRCWNPCGKAVTSLQGKLEEAITKSKLLLEAVEGSQSKHTELNEDYPVLRSLKRKNCRNHRVRMKLCPQRSSNSNLNCESFVKTCLKTPLHDQVRKELQAVGQLITAERFAKNDGTKKEEFTKERLKLGQQQLMAAYTSEFLLAPVSKAKALLLTKQGHALRIHKNKLTVNIADRDELQKKLQKSKEQIQKLEDALRKQALGLVHNKKQQRQLREEIRWSQVNYSGFYRLLCWWGDERYCELVEV